MRLEMKNYIMILRKKLNKILVLSPRKVDKNEYPVGLSYIIF